MKKDFHADQLPGALKINPDDQAFSTPGNTDYHGNDGLTKFEYAVFSALNGLCARAYPLATIPRDAVDVARKTIEEMNK